MIGGRKGPFTRTVVLALLFVVSVSRSLPTTVAVFVSVPVVCARVTSVTVTLLPAGMLPIAHEMTAPPVQAPCVVATETKLVPAGTGSATVTPVAPLGPLFVTTIVHVTLPASVAGFGVPIFVIDRSIVGAGGAGGGGGDTGGAALVFVSVQVTVAPAVRLTAAEQVLLVREYPSTTSSLTT